MAPRVKNKNATPIQITAEQILREASQLQKRKEYEDLIRRAPEQEVWLSYIRFELRFNEIERARSIFERYVDCHPYVIAWMGLAEFEMEYGDIERARNCYERAVDKFEGDLEDLFALDHKFIPFEKGFEDAIYEKRRLEYEDGLRKNPLNYDIWFDYIRLVEEIGGDKQTMEDLYERAIANVPPSQEKRYWRRYIYLWINYALYEELEIPKIRIIWLMAAQFEVRQLNIGRARKILGSAIGMAPKDTIFTKYVEMELQLGNVKRCRKIYEKYLEWAPKNVRAWTKFAEFEDFLGETERAEAISEMMPKKKLLKKKRLHIEIEDDDLPQEEDMQRRNLQLLEAAYKWKNTKIGIQ
ncbi:hypothetical protein MIMGU_mgv11b022575mg [Erythranthe guttata]|uniref:Pre-mRNA-splicing factor Syf1-like N-terminal HAT-repeats domain-containing protein n=1 Tax=Erythranthe guttata TaxID=4155 RepID=A0A022RJV0_ERYGU|nr:hypothetical protein MIMGU_mgv11b022575mg [Erythranthe guttata]